MYIKIINSCMQELIRAWGENSPVYLNRKFQVIYINYSCKISVIKYLKRGGDQIFPFDFIDRILSRQKSGFVVYCCFLSFSNLFNFFYCKYYWDFWLSFPEKLLSQPQPSEKLSSEELSQLLSFSRIFLAWF